MAWAGQVAGPAGPARRRCRQRGHFPSPRRLCSSSPLIITINSSGAGVIITISCLIMSYHVIIIMHMYMIIVCSMLPALGLPLELWGGGGARKQARGRTKPLGGPPGGAADPLSSRSGRVASRSRGRDSRSVAVSGNSLFLPHGSLARL